MKQRILYFTDATAAGGAEEMLLILLSGLDRSQWESVIIHRASARLDQWLDRLHTLQVATLELPRATRDITWVPWMRRKLRSERPAIFHAHCIAPLDCSYGILSAALERLPIVVTQHLYNREFARRHRVRQALVHAAVDRYIAVSFDIARALAPNGTRFGNRVHVIHNGIPLQPFQVPVEETLRDALPRPTDKPIVLCLARLHPQKGLRYLLQAAALVPEALFVLAGEGPDRRELELEARELGIEDRVVFLGYRKDIPNLLAGCDLFVLPSLYEGLPVSILEAMASGKPVVASRIPGTDEAVVDGDTGLLVEPRDVNALATAIRTLLNDRTLAARFGSAGRARAHKLFSLETMADRTMRLYSELLESQKADRNASS